MGATLRQIYLKFPDYLRTAHSLADRLAISPLVAALIQGQVRARYPNCLSKTGDCVCTPETGPGEAFIQSISAVEQPPLCGQAITEIPEEQLFSVRSGWRARLFIAVSFPVVLALIVVTVMFALSRKGVSDPDIWWHLHNAQHLVEQHSLARTDTYSFTVPGHPWISHEWLAELPYYFAWRALGLGGINAVMFAVLTLIFLGTLYLCYRESGHYKASVMAACFAVFLGSVSFGPRTILFGYAYLVILLIVLQRFRQGGNASLWSLPPLFCVWVNTHGSWLIGIAIFSIVIAAGMVRGEWGFISSEPWTPSQRKKLLLSWSASVGALFVNPFGARLVFYPLDLAFRQKLNIEHVAEWVSVNFHDTRGKLVIVLLVVLLVSSCLRPRRWTLTELGVVLFALYSGLTYIRFLFLLGIVIAPVLAKMFEFVPRYRRNMDTPVINTLVIILIVGGMVHFWPREAQLQELVADQYPAQAVSYLQAHPPAGRMLNFYLWGGYLSWCEPSLKIFLDSRVDIFEYSGVLQDYLDLLALKDPDLLLDKYKIRYVLFPRNEPLTYVLQHDAKWKVLYSDKISVLLERTGDNAAEHRTNASSHPASTGELSLARAAVL